jgi:hypothetical protein
MTYKIEKGVPIDVGRAVYGKSKYPFYRLEIGDSFFVADAKVGSLRNIGSNLGKRLGRKFYTREVDGGARVWRTE